MRIIGLGSVAASLWLSACTTSPMFPPVVMKDVEANTFDAKAWEDQAYHPSSTTFVPHKVELAGEIIKVIRKPDSVVILAEERPLDVRSTSNQAGPEEDGSPWFAVTFKGSVESRMLQAGNRFIAVGTTDRAGAEMFGGAPRVLPHLRARCLHIWNTEGAKNMYFFTDTGFAKEYPPEERTVCREEIKPDARSGDGQDEEKKTSAGS